LLKLELDSLQSVREGAAEFLKRSKQLNVLINNAGMVAGRRFLEQGPWCSAYLILSVGYWFPLLRWRLGRVNENIALETS
jgi:NAD(P)-dependent dehydrogenase (short-subunit alcohol dehydrogenase family)